MGKIGYILIIALYLVYLINETYFVINKKEIEATIVEPTKEPGSFDSLTLEFEYNNKMKNLKITVKNSIFDKIHNNESVIIYYDDFILQDLYFKIRLFLYYVLLVLFFYPKLLFNSLFLIEQWIKK